PARTTSRGSDTTGKFFDECLRLIGTQTAQATALSDLEPLHDLDSSHLADSGDRLKEINHLDLGDRLIVLGFGEYVFDSGTRMPQSVLHLGTNSASLGRFVERGLSLFRSQIGQHDGLTSP